MDLISFAFNNQLLFILYADFEQRLSDGVETCDTKNEKNYMQIKYENS